MNSMSSGQSFRTQLDGLATQEDILQEKLTRFRKALAIETGEAIKFQLENQIQQTNDELTKTRREMGSIAAYRLYDSLLKLDYRPQEQLFMRFRKNFPFGAYLIHGPAEHGQRWLLNRLISRYPQAAKVICLKLNRRTKKYDINGHWRDLASEVGSGKGASHDQVAQAVCECFRTQDVIIVIQEIEEMPPAYLNDLHEQFWKPLATAARANSLPASGHRLVLMLVDYLGLVCSWGLNFQFVAQYDPAWDQIPPVQLPEIGLFTEDELTRWAEVMQSELPDELQDPETIAEILKDSGGVPEVVFERMFECIDWDEGVDPWMKY